MTNLLLLGFAHEVPGMDNYCIGHLTVVCGKKISELCVVWAKE